MKKLLQLFIFTGLACIAHSQVRVGILGGANRSTILEKNSLANWDSIKKNYSPIYSFHGGVFADFPLNRKANLSFQPAVIYYNNKGRKYSQKFDTSRSFTADSSLTQQLNYIDIPLNLLVKFKLAKKVKFFLGGGPYASFFFKGSEKSVINYKDGTTVSATNSDLPVGKAPGKYTTLDYGVNVTAGFEIGHVFIRGDASQSLADMYQASNYKGSFRNQVISASIGVSMDLTTPSAPKKKLPDTTAKTTKPPKDKDKDGVSDKEDQCPTVAGTKELMGCPDRDGDGVADKDDRCPDKKGSVSNHGCPAPDTDNDGVPDDLDKCPTVKGLEKYNGCPSSDSDGDGVPDDQDNCPTVAGLLRYNGCPIPDTDGDGVNDEIDHCKTVPGLSTNHGCPEKQINEVNNEATERVNYNSKKIQFELNKSDLLPSSFAAMDEIVKLLNENPAYKLKIEGHASMEGDHFKNLKLSEDRAAAVKNYLVSKGIDAGRLTTIGYGNARVLTIDRQQQAINRRVEMKLYQ